MPTSFLGQYLSDRRPDVQPDSTKDKAWMVLRYLILLGFFIGIVTQVDRNPGGGFLVSLGGALLASAVVNVLLLPKPQRRDGLNAIWAVGGITALVAGLLILA